MQAKYVLCVRVADARAVVAGAVKVQCESCSAWCWLSPSSPKGLSVRCLHCIPRDTAFAPFTEAQKAEVLAHFAKGQS